MPAKSRSKVLCQRAVPYELYKGLTFTTIWLEVNPRKKMLEGLCLCRAFLNLRMQWRTVMRNVLDCINAFIPLLFIVSITQDTSSVSESVHAMIFLENKSIMLVRQTNPSIVQMQVISEHQTAFGRSGLNCSSRIFCNSVLKSESIMKHMITKECKWSISVDGYENSIKKGRSFL